MKKRLFLSEYQLQSYTHMTYQKKLSYKTHFPQNKQFLRVLKSIYKQIFEEQKTVFHTVGYNIYKLLLSCSKTAKHVKKSSSLLKYCAVLLKKIVSPKNPFVANYFESRLTVNQQHHYRSFRRLLFFNDFYYGFYGQHFIHRIVVNYDVELILNIQYNIDQIC